MASWCLSSCFFFLMKLTLNLSERLSPVRPSLHPPVIDRNMPPVSHAAPYNICLYIYLSISVSSVFFLLFFCFYLDRKTPEVFLVGNSWRGMLLREQGVRVESRFSGSSLTPCSAIPSRARCHDRHRVRTRSGVRKLSPVLAQPDHGVLVAHSTCALLHSDSFFPFCSLSYITVWMTLPLV